MRISQPAWGAPAPAPGPALAGGDGQTLLSNLPSNAWFKAIK